MQLSKVNLHKISSSLVSTPPASIFLLPEKIIQFGTGVLLRALVDYFVDRANRQELFNGRVLIVKSTGQGEFESFKEQDNLYTICVRGIEDSIRKEEYFINSSVSRVLSATADWQQILQAAHNPELKIVVSNTTEVGIVLTDDNIHSAPPQSFPGKLLAFLYERYKFFDGTKDSGMIIIPTELLIANGTQLKSIIIRLAQQNQLEPAFISWISDSNHFCNSLVDRIVPGKLQERDRIAAEKNLGYEDRLMVMAEPFRLWAIESGNQEVKQALSFEVADDGVVIAPDIEKFRELKLRLLNGTHTLSCGLAHLAGFTTVREAMSDPVMAAYTEQVALNEIAPAASGKNFSYPEACAYAAKVIERFKNPFIDHYWLNITLQYSAKMKMRNLPVLLWHYEKSQKPPSLIALGFAAYIRFMKPGKNEEQENTGFFNEKMYKIQDNEAAYFAQQWQHGPADVVKNVLSDQDFWGANLAVLPGFITAVESHLKSLEDNGALATIRSLVAQKK